MNCLSFGCDRKVVAQSLCMLHYRRMKRHGDIGNPTVNKNPSGEGRAWLDANMNYDGEDCLIWPFTKTKVTFIRVDGVGVKTYVYMCALVNGPRPTPKHEAAHSCGKGHEGCVHPKHLRWATHKENIADKKLHGTQAHGSQVPSAKLTETEVVYIRNNPDKMTGKGLAARFGVTNIHISRIKNGKAWGWLDINQNMV